MEHGMFVFLAEVFKVTRQTLYNHLQLYRKGELHKVEFKYKVILDMNARGACSCVMKAMALKLQGWQEKEVSVDE